MANYGEQSPQVSRILVEEKQYGLPFGEGADLVKRAAAHALGVTLEELAPGMWAGSKKADEHSFLDVTIRALEVDDGTSIEIRLEHRFTAKAIALFTLGIVTGCALILPLIPTILITNRVHKKHQRQRLVEIHRAWTEIGRAVGAPRKTGYREPPKRAYAPMRVADVSTTGGPGADAEAGGEALEQEATRSSARLR